MPSVCCIFRVQRLMNLIKMINYVPRKHIYKINHYSVCAKEKVKATCEK